MKAEKTTKYIIQWTELFFKQCKQMLLGELSIINHLYLVLRYKTGREHRQESDWDNCARLSTQLAQLAHDPRNKIWKLFWLPNGGVGMQVLRGISPVIWQRVRQMSWWTAGVEAWTVQEGHHLDSTGGSHVQALLPLRCFMAGYRDASKSPQLLQRGIFMSPG